MANCVFGNPDVLPKLFVVGLLVLYTLVLPAAWLAFDRYTRRFYGTRWFDVANGAVPVWRDINVLTIQDPLTYVNEKRSRGWRRVSRDLFVVLLLFLFWCVGLVGVVVLIGNPSKDNLAIASYLFGFATVVGAAIKLTYDWRQKTHSENRQNWINEVRDSLSQLIASMPSEGDDPECRRTKAETYALQHAKLELLLNPSEKDHRAIMALIRHIFGCDDASIDKIPREELGISAFDPKVTQDCQELKSRIIRLANAILKREWERVKYLQ